MRDKNFKISFILIISIILLVTAVIWVPLLLLGIFLIVFYYLLAWLIPFFVILGTGISLVIGLYSIPAGLVALFKVSTAYGIGELGIGLFLLGVSMVLMWISFYIIKLFFIIPKSILWIIEHGYQIIKNKFSRGIIND